MMKCMWGCAKKPQKFYVMVLKNNEDSLFGGFLDISTSCSPWAGYLHPRQFSFDNNDILLVSLSLLCRAKLSGEEIPTLDESVDKVLQKHKR